MRSKTRVFLLFGLSVAAAGVLASCGGTGKVQAKDPGEPGLNSSSTDVSVGVVKVGKKDLGRTLTLSSELVPFQEIDVYAKESGFVKELNVDYGSHVQKDQVLATLEIPELQLQVKEDDAAIKNAADQITHAQDELNRVEAQHKVLQLQFDRLNGVRKSKPGLVAQQEVDDSAGQGSGRRSASGSGEVEPAVRTEPARSRRKPRRSTIGAVRLLQNHRAIRRRGDAALRQSRHADAGRHQLQHAGHAAGPALAGRPVPPGHSGAGVLRPVHSYWRSGQRHRAFAQPNLPGQGGALLGGREGRHAHHAHRSGRAESRSHAASRACTPKRPSRSSERRTRSRSRCRP